MAIAVGVSGICGRMGRMICEMIPTYLDMRLVGGVEGPDSGVIGSSISCGGREVPIHATAEFPIDVLIDVSTPQGTRQNLELAREGRFAMVVGVTGLTVEHEALITQVAAKRAVLVAPNLSVGMNLLFDLVRYAVAQLGPQFDVEIIETHHRHKLDAPSGTALKLLEMVREARAGQKGRRVGRRGRGGEEAVGAGAGAGEVMSVGYGRKGSVGPRREGEVHVHAVRGGDVVGDHVILLAGPGERIELIHRATSRACFAQGALEAARFAASAPPGRYGMTDVLEKMRAKS